MRPGITQEQVNAAADALVAAGDRPTVGKVRAVMGTGSPNTVTRMLDTWRSGLAERLQNVLHLPELPPEAGQAMTTLWQLAVEHAERLLQARMATDRATLATKEARIVEERTRWTATLRLKPPRPRQGHDRNWPSTLVPIWTANSAIATPTGKIWFSSAIGCKLRVIDKGTSSKPSKPNVLPASLPRSRNANAPRHTSARSKIGCIRK
jgi:hypothetical protein